MLNFRYSPINEGVIYGYFPTAGAIIDVKQGRLTLEIGGDKVTFNLANTLSRPMIEDTCYAIDIVDDSMYDFWTCSLARDPLEALIALDDFAENVLVDYEMMNTALRGREFTIEKGETVNAIMAISDAVEVKKPELKPLPSHLKYVFLDESELYPIIVNANLDANQLSLTPRFIKESLARHSLINRAVTISVSRGSE